MFKNKILIKLQYIIFNALALKLNSGCNLQNPRFKSQDLTFHALSYEKGK